MLISDLTYQEIAVESNHLEGGIDLAQIANFLQSTKGVTTGMTAGPGGVAIVTTALDAFTNSLGNLTIKI